MKKRCEYCKYYEEDYQIKCNSCRVDGGWCNHSKFELNEELAELERCAKIGKATEKAFNYGDILIDAVWDNGRLTDLSDKITDVDELLEWAESEGK